MTCTCFLPLPLDRIANASLVEHYRDPPLEKVELCGVPFVLKPRDGMFDTSAMDRDKPGQVELVPDNPVERAVMVHLLINAGGGSGAMRQAVYHLKGSRSGESDSCSKIALCRKPDSYWAKTYVSGLLVMRRAASLIWSKTLDRTSHGVAETRRGMRQ